MRESGLIQESTNLLHLPVIEPRIAHFIAQSFSNYVALDTSWFLALPTTCGLDWLETTFRKPSDYETRVFSRSLSIQLTLEDGADKEFRNVVFS